VCNIKRLNHIADDVQKTYSLKYDDLKMELDQKKNECTEMKRQISLLQKEVSDLRKQVVTGEQPQGGIKKASNAHLVLADSTLRDVDPAKLDDTGIVAISGGKISSLRERLQEYHGSSYSSLTFHVAANDLSDIKDEHDKLQGIIDEYKDLIREAKAITDKVVVSSVCPRLDDVNGLVRPFNEALEAVCDDDSNVTFVDHTRSFTLGDGKINDGYIWRNGPHLTRPGVNCVVRNLGVQVREGESDVTRLHQHLQRGSGDRNVHGNRYRRQHSDGPDNVRINRDGCRFCNERGHNVDSCRHSQPVKCNICSLRGHKAKHHVHHRA